MPIINFVFSIFKEMSENIWLKLMHQRTIKELDKIKLASSFDEATEKFEQLCNEFKGKYHRFINTILQKSKHYFAFTKYPDEVRKHIYTTNAVESVNSLNEKIRIKLGGYFNSVDVLEINIYLQRENLK